MAVRVGCLSRYDILNSDGEKREYPDFFAYMCKALSVRHSEISQTQNEKVEVSEQIHEGFMRKNRWYGEDFSVDGEHVCRRVYVQYLHSHGYYEFQDRRLFCASMIVYVTSVYNYSSIQKSVSSGEKGSLTLSVVVVNIVEGVYDCISEAEFSGQIFDVDKHFMSCRIGGNQMPK